MPRPKCPITIADIREKELPTAGPSSFKKKEEETNINWCSHVGQLLVYQMKDEYVSKYLNGNKTQCCKDWVTAIGIGHLDPKGLKTEAQVLTILSKYKTARTLAESTGFGDAAQKVKLPNGKFVEEKVNALDQLTEICPHYQTLDKFLNTSVTTGLKKTRGGITEEGLRRPLVLSGSRDSFPSVGPLKSPEDISKTCGNNSNSLTKNKRKASEVSFDAENESDEEEILISNSKKEKESRTVSKGTPGQQKLRKLMGLQQIALDLRRDRFAISKLKYEARIVEHGGASESQREHERQMMVYKLQLEEVQIRKEELKFKQLTLQKELATLKQNEYRRNSTLKPPSTLKSPSIAYSPIDRYNPAPFPFSSFEKENETSIVDEELDFAGEGDNDESK